MDFGFEWDGEKARGNYAKHRVTLPEAATVFGDPLARTIDDPLHLVDEDRFIIVIGESEQGRLLVVVYTERGDRIRIISAREANRGERQAYEQG